MYSIIFHFLLLGSKKKKNSSEGSFAPFASTPLSISSFLHTQYSESGIKLEETVWEAGIVKKRSQI